MNDPITMIVIFDSRDKVVEAVQQLADLELKDIARAAVIAKASTGDLVVVDNEVTPLDGRRAGMRLGALMTALGMAQLGAFALPGIGPIIALGTGVLVGGLVGGATGQFAATLISFGFKKEQIETLSEHLKEDEVALIIELEERDRLPQLHAALSHLNAEILEAAGYAPHATDFKHLPRQNADVE